MDKIIYCVLNLCLFLHKSRAKRVTNDKRGTEHVRQATQIKASSSALDVTQRKDSYQFSYRDSFFAAHNGFCG